MASYLTSQRGQRRPSLRAGEIPWSVLFLAPMVTLALAFKVYPVVRSIKITMYNWNGIGNPTQYVGLRHFKTVANDPMFWNAFENTIQYTLVLVPIQLTLALLLAMVLNQPKTAFKTFYRTAFFLPVVTSIAIVAVVVRLMLQTGGLQISDFFNIKPPINPIGNPQYSMWSVIIFGTWYSFGINLIYFLASLQTVPQELYDAAKVDGANGLQQIKNVTLPCIRPMLTIQLFLALLGSLRVFEQSFVLTGGGPYFSSEVVSGYIYTYAFGGGGRFSGPANLGYASAAAFFMSLLILGITGAQILITRRLNTNRGK